MDYVVDQISKYVMKDEIWRVDIGMSEAFGPNVKTSENSKSHYYLKSLTNRSTRIPQVLEILDDKHTHVLIPYHFFVEKIKRTKKELVKLKKAIPNQANWIDDLWDKIGKMEDLEDMKREEDEKKRKYLKKKHRR